MGYNFCETPVFKVFPVQFSRSCPLYLYNYYVYINEMQDLINAKHLHSWTFVNPRCMREGYSSRSICLAIMPCAFLWYPLTVWLAELVCMHAVLGPIEASNLQL